jgi:carbonic anhydrase
MFTNILLLATTAIALAVHAAEIPTKANSTIKFDTLDALYKGNQRFRASAGRRAVAARVVEERTSPVFLVTRPNFWP